MRVPQDRHRGLCKSLVETIRITRISTRPSIQKQRETELEKEESHANTTAPAASSSATANLPLTALVSPSTSMPVPKRSKVTSTTPGATSSKLWASTTAGSWLGTD